MARGILNFIDPSHNGRILAEDMSGCERGQNNRNGLPLITKNTFHPWEVKIEDGVYAEEDYKVRGEDFEWGISYPSLKI